MSARFWFWVILAALLWAWAQGDQSRIHSRVDYNQPTVAR